MAAASRTLPDLNALAHEELKSLILAQQAELVAQGEQLLSRDVEIDNLKLLILKLKRMQFGRKSEKLDRQIEQLELQLEDLEASPATSDPIKAVSRISISGDEVLRTTNDILCARIWSLVLLMIQAISPHNKSSAMNPDRNAQIGF